MKITYRIYQIAKSYEETCLNEDTLTNSYIIWMLKKTSSYWLCKTCVYAHRIDKHLAS